MNRRFCYTLLALSHWLAVNARAAEGFCGDICPIKAFTAPFAYAGEGLPAAGINSNYFVVGSAVHNVLNVARGAVYIYNPNTLEHTITNSQVRAGQFGKSVAAMDSARFLVGAPRNNANTNGAVYLYALRSSALPPLLVGTYNNPSNLISAFGFSVAAVGPNSHRILVGAPNYTVGSYVNSGAAYLFNTNGVLSL